MIEQKSAFYLRKHNRYSVYDYSTDGYYFVTICADQKRHIFGKVDGTQVILSDLGKVIYGQIEELSQYTSIAVRSYIIMPNHLHMLIQIKNDGMPKKMSLPDLMRRLKSKVWVEFSKTEAYKRNENEYSSIWQRSYWDNIVRKEEDLILIDEYIRRNPEFWNKEIDNPKLDYPVN